MKQGWADGPGTCLSVRLPKQLLQVTPAMLRDDASIHSASRFMLVDARQGQQRSSVAAGCDGSSEVG